MNLCKLGFFKLFLQLECRNKNIMIIKVSYEGIIEFFGINGNSMQESFYL